MSDAFHERESIKKHVRAVLLSSPVELTVTEFQRDYHNFIGEPIDHRRIGYSRLEDFLRELHDVVQIGYRRGVMTLKAKPDETTAHIQSLVSRQKIPNKRKFAIHRQHGVGGGSRRYQPPPRYHSSPSHSRYNQPSPPPPMVPAYIRSQLRALLNSFPNGLAVSQLDTAFNRMFGTGINYRHYGFPDQHELLRSMPNIVQLQQSNFDWRVYPIPEAKSPSTQTQQQQSPESQKGPPSYLTSPELSNTMTGVLTQPSPTETGDNQQRPSKGRGKRRSGSGSTEGSVGHERRSSGSAQMDLLEKEIQQVLEKHPSGVWSSRFSNEYQNLHKKVFSFTSLGYVSVIEMMSNHPDVVRITRPNPQGDWLLFDARLPAPDTPQEDLFERDAHRMQIKQNMESSIKRILSIKCNGIPFSQFPTVYKECTGRELPLKELGFKDVEQLYYHLSEHVLQVSYSQTGEPCLFSYGCAPAVANAEPRTPSVTRSSSSLAGQDDYPEDVVGPGCHYMPVMCPPVHEYTELYVTNITHPGLFWIYLRHKTKALALEDLMDSLEKVYRGGSDRYRMPEELMVRGQVCATLFPEDNNWHRGVITGKQQAGFLEIYYVDYGNMNYVAKSTIRFLKQEFLMLPAQAIQCRLAHLQPKGQKWTRKSRLRFMQLTRAKPLVALVNEVKDQVMSVMLVDTNDPNVDHHINDMLVIEGQAEFKPDDEVPDVFDQKLEGAPDYNHVFGWTEAPRLPKVAQIQHKEPEATGSFEQGAKEQSCYIRWMQLTGEHVFHVINLAGAAYVVSEEISALFWEDDILSSMLHRSNVYLDKLVVSSADNPKLFEELAKYKFTCKQMNLIENQHFLTLYKLDSLPRILSTFQCEDEALINAVSELVSKFDPNSPFWKDGSQFRPISPDQTPANQSPVAEKQSPELQPSSEEEGVQSKGQKRSSDEEDNQTNNEQISLEEKQMCLKALQIKRQRILQQLMNNPSSTVEVVNQLNDCEVEILMIKEEIAQHNNSTTEGKRSISPLDLPSSATCQTESQQRIQDIIASTTKPIAAANIVTKPTARIASSQANVSCTQSMHQSMVNNNLGNQSTTGSYTGIMGNPAFAQQQTFMNPFLMPQPGTDMTGVTQMMASMGLNQGFATNLGSFQMPAFNPFLFPGNNLAISSAPSTMNPFGSLPTFGRGQPMNSSNIGILPCLLPLMHNFSAGRGNARGVGNNQS